YTISDNTVIVKSKVNSPSVYQIIDIKENKVENQLITIGGQVTDIKGEPLLGVSVKVKGSSVGTTTDINGRYSLNVPNNDVILVFTYVGFVSQELTIDGRTSINVELEADNTALNEVVIIGYGTSSLANLTGSVSTVDVEKAMSSR